MKAVIVGAGVIGVTTAYALRRRGYEVVVIDREQGPGRDTSFANGALLTPGMAEPWNAPGVWRTLLASIGRSEAAIQMHLGSLPGLAAWGIEFLHCSKPQVFEANAVKNVSLALYSQQVLQSLREETNLEYCRTTRGSLRLFRDRGALESASAAAKGLMTEGLKVRTLSVGEMVGCEPCLASIANQFSGALHYLSDESGDAYQFCVGMANRARERGVELRFGTEVSSLEVKTGRVTAAVTGQGRIVGDQYIIAAGSYSPSLLRQAGVRLPVKPVKGYSLTLDARGHSLTMPVIDDHAHVVVVPLNAAIRIAGTAEFAGFNRQIRPERTQGLLRLLRELLPQAPLDDASARPWCGLRPMSADGVPIIGPTTVANLLVNIGHGHLGWTLAAGSAQLLADLMNRTGPSIDPAQFAPARFG